MVNCCNYAEKKLSIRCFVIVEACLCGSKVSYFSSCFTLLLIYILQFFLLAI